MKALEFLNKVGVYYLATTEGDQARVRPLGFVMECNGKLHFVHQTKRKCISNLMIILK